MLALSPMIVKTVWGVLLFAGLAGLAGNGAAQQSGTGVENRAPAEGLRPQSNEVFSDATLASGIDFIHFNGMSGELYLAEIMGPGAALFDYDTDGDLDLFLVQGAMLGGGKTLKDALSPPANPAAPGGRLFRNELIGRDGKPGRLRFTDVTGQSGIRAKGYGMGVAAGDFNNDGWIDLYLTNFGSNQMLRNNGDRTFTDVTAEAGTDSALWSVSAAFVDYDRDGWLDLYVGNYVDFSLSNHKRCSAYGRDDYCGPKSFTPSPEKLFRNRGDGTFEDMSAASGIGGESNGALGIVAADFNRDGWIDLYIANDQRPNHLWMNLQDGTFENQALLLGCALSEDGKPQASMGVDAGDFDNDGDEDLFMTHLVNETNALYVNDGAGAFEERSYAAGLGSPSLPFTAFGAAFLDYDNDGWLDILSVNGEVKTIEALAKANDSFPLHQPNQLFRNLRDGRFADVTAEAGAVFKLSEVSRGAAFGDVDNDGDADVLVMNNNGRARLLLNQVGNRNQWIGLRMMDTQGKRDMLGTRVAVFREGRPTLWRRVRSDSSYASSNDPRVLFGLGESAPSSVTVRAYWAGGRVEEWPDVPTGRYSTLREGSGKPGPTP